MARPRWNAERLVHEAAVLADEEGFAAVTPSALARRVGLTVPSLYAHVSGAQDLRVRVALLALEELSDRLGAALAGRAGAHALAALGEVHRSYARAHPGRWEAAKLRLDAQSARTSAGPRLSRLVRDALLGYALDAEEETHAVRLVGSTIRGFVDLETAGSFDHSPPDPDTSWARVLEALDALLRSWPRTSERAPT